MHAEPIEISWNPELSIYASEAFLNIEGYNHGWLGGRDEAGKLRCVLPYIFLDKGLVKRARFITETIYLDGVLDIDTERSFLNSAINYFRSNGAAIIIPAKANAVFRTYPESAESVPYGTLIIDLGQSEEFLWENMHQKHRNVIRNAKKNGVQILRGVEYVEAAYRIIKETFRRSKLTFMNAASFMRFVSALGQYIEVFIAEYQGTIQGCAIMPFSNYSAYYTFGGTAQKSLLGSSNYLQWEAIRHFRSLGVRRYDFNGVSLNPDKGSKQAGIMMFMERFGASQVQGYMWKRSIMPFKALIYSTASRLLKGGDAVDRERRRMKTQNKSSAS